jgi:O-antigen/teichoic acid export membrane protein
MSDSPVADTSARGSSLLGSVLVYTLTNVVSAAVPFLMLPVLTRVLAPAEYGQVAMFSVALTLLGAFTGLNVHAAIGVRYFERARLDFPRYVGTCLIILAVSTVVVLALIALLLPWLQPIAKLPARWLLAAAVVSAAQILIQIQLAIWQSARRPYAYGALRLGQSVLDGSISLVLVLALGLAWQGRAAGIAAAAGLSAALCLYLLIRWRWARWPLSRDYAFNALRFGVPLIPHTLGGVLLAMVDRVMISNVLGVASTGIYMVALQIGMVLGLATDAFNRAYAPWLLEGLGTEQPARDVAIVRFTYGYFIVVIIAAAALGLLAPLILQFLVGAQFRAAAPIVRYVALGFAFCGMYYMVTNYVFYAGRTASLALITLLCGCSNAGLAYWLLHRRGVIGAAQAFMLAQAMLFAGTWWLAQRARPMPWRRALLKASSR